MFDDRSAVSVVGRRLRTLFFLGKKKTSWKTLSERSLGVLVFREYWRSSNIHDPIE